MQQTDHGTSLPLTAHACECGVLTWTAQSRLGGMLLPSGSRIVYPALCREGSSSFHMCLLAGWKNSSVCLTTAKRGGDGQDGGKEREKEGGRETQREILLSGPRVDTLCFRCDSMRDSNAPFSPLTSHLSSHSLSPLPHSPSILGPASHFQAEILPYMEWLDMLPSCGRNITTNE